MTFIKYEDNFNSFRPSSFENIKFNFGSAHYNFKLSHFPDVKKLEINNLMIKASGQRHRIIPEAERLNLVDASVAIEKILLNETSLDLNNNKIIPWLHNTRLTITAILDQILSYHDGQDTIALPIPNWHFWHCLGYGDEFNFTFFEAYDEEQLVNNFKILAKKGKLSALILSFPATPLMYTPSANAIKEIDRIALKHGIEIIVDDVLRGIQPIGQRDTIARHCTRPYIVEGLGKRFGEHLSGFSFSLMPKDSFVLNPNFTDTLSYYFGTLVDYAYTNDSPRAIKALEKRNLAFDMGFMEHAPEEIKIIRPSASNITTLLEFPECLKDTSSEFADSGKRFGLETYCINNFFPPPFQNKRRDSLRITVGMMEEDQIYDGASILGNALKKLYEKLT